MIARGYRRSIWHRLRYQLGGAILLGAVLPTVLRALTLSGDFDALAILYQTFLGAFLAILLGTWLLRSVTTYPGVEAGAFVLPAFSLSFGVVLMVLVFGRLEYNRTVLLAGYGLSVGWFLVVHTLLHMRRHLRIGVLPFGDRSAFGNVSGIEWVELSSPDADISGLNAVAADLRADLPSEWDRRLADYALQGLPVYHNKHLFESLTGRVQLEHLSENSFGSLAPMSAFMTVKHIIDWIVAVVAGIVLLPFLVGIGIAIRLTSPGPALFRQQRIGYRGVPFTVYKFRTMRVAAAPAADAARDHAITQPGDSRVTRFGRFLRTSRIDELPQILNILRGEMSWIGPRPEAEILSQWYRDQIPFYRYRHIVRPGIAGWAQVCQGHVAAVEEVTSKLHYDFYYIKQFSPWIDLLIMIRTVGIMVTGFGSR